MSQNCEENFVTTEITGNQTRIIQVIPQTAQT